MRDVRDSYCWLLVWSLVTIASIVSGCSPKIISDKLAAQTEGTEVGAQDTTPPVLTTIDDGSITLSLSTSPSFSWVSATETGSGLLRYELSIGTAPGLTDVAGWRDAGTGTSGQISGLSLSYGTTYYTNLRAVDLAYNTSAAISGDGWQPTPAVETGALPVSVPEAFPYQGQASVDYENAPPVYSLQDSTCTGLSIDSSTGLVSGILTAVDGESCSYKVRATMDAVTTTSNALTVNVGPSLNFSFNTDTLYLRKGDPAQQLVLNLSSPAPFSSRISYSLYSDQTENEFLGELDGLATRGYIDISSGQSSVSLDLRVPLGSSLTDGTYQTFKIDTGTKESKPSALLGLHSDPVPEFDLIAAGADHTCGIDEGRLYCWGSDSSGQLGNGATTGNVTSPTQIGASTTWTAVAAGLSHTCGINGGKL
ncbi:MAG TPA: hypothetical protein DCS07_01275, partial [Bdellovibrionales bacterium]|nr:hypothetical protein [Bdellovibrionales bacterium]